MSKELRVLKAVVRSESGKGPARRLRAGGRVPAVTYSRGKQNRMLTLDRADVERLVSHGERLVRLEIDGEQTQAMIKEVQHEPLSRLIAHVDFQEISATETIELEVPIKVRGVPAGAKDGGVLNVVMHEIEVEALASQIPEEIRIDVTALKIGDSIRAGEITLPEGLKLVTDPDSTVVALERPRSETDAESQVAPETGAAEPEVLTAKKEEEGAPAAAEAGEPKEKEKKPEASA
jgi:large subunit ribosomal protein L25